MRVNKQMSGGWLPLKAAEANWGEERLSLNTRGEVVYRLKKPWDDGTVAIKMTQLELIERLVALVPRPRVHLTRFHGVLGPHYKYRKQIVRKIKVQLAPVEDNDPDKPPPSARMPWARLLKRVFNFDISTCPKCAGKIKIIAAIEDPSVIKKILNHMGLASLAPKLHPARGPPQSDQVELFSQESFES